MVKTATWAVDEDETRVDQSWEVVKEPKLLKWTLLLWSRIKRVAISGSACAKWFNQVLFCTDERRLTVWGFVTNRTPHLNTSCKNILSFAVISTAMTTLRSHDKSNLSLRECHPSINRYWNRRPSPSPYLNQSRATLRCDSSILWCSRQLPAFP